MRSAVKKCDGKLIILTIAFALNAAVFAWYGMPQVSSRLKVTSGLQSMGVEVDQAGVLAVPGDAAAEKATAVQIAKADRRMHQEGDEQEPGKSREARLGELPQQANMQTGVQTPAPAIPLASHQGANAAGSERHAGVAGSQRLLLTEPGRTLPKRIVWAYWAKWGDDPEPFSSLLRASGVVNIFSPYWFTVMPDGSLSAREADHQALLRRVSAAGARTLIMLNNYGDGVLRDPAARERAAENILALVRRYGVSGVNIDFEELPPQRRDDLTAFVTSVSRRLRPEGYLTTVAVGPKWSDESLENDMAQVYDYPALGAVADLIVLMTYDQSGTFSGPGPVAGLPWVERVVRYAVSRVPSGKLLLGVAAYGYDWEEGGAVRAVTVPQAFGLASAAGASLEWDEKSAEPYFVYSGADGRQHTVWFESLDALRLKTELAARFGLRGVAVWSMGQEDESTWTLLGSWAGGD